MVAYYIVMPFDWMHIKIRAPLYIWFLTTMYMHKKKKVGLRC